MDIIYAFILLFMQFLLVPGLVFGSTVGPGALGITLIYSILRFATFAHSESMAFGAASGAVPSIFYLGWVLGPCRGLVFGLPFVLAATIGMLLAFNFFVFRFYQRARSVAVIFTVVSVGVMFMTNALVRFWSARQSERWCQETIKFVLLE